MNAALKVEGLSKTFGDTHALQHLALTLEPGEVRALLGENGSGKSTLIKILSGFHRPDEGTVLVAGRAVAWGNPAASLALGLRFVHQNLGLVEHSSVEDNLALTYGFPTRFGLVRGRISRARTSSALESVGLHIAPKTPIMQLSPAERTGVAVARALLDIPGADQAKVLVLDEPTATLPDTEVDRVVELVRAVQLRGTAVIYVTHRLEEVFRVASSVTILRDGCHVTTTSVQGLTRADLVRFMVGSELDEVQREARAIRAQTTDHVLRVDRVSAPRIRDVSLSVAPGEIVGVAGITGSGREELCATIFGAEERLGGGDVSIGGISLSSGSPRTAIKLGAAYIPADRQRLGGLASLSARENLAISNEGLMSSVLLDRKREQRDTEISFDRFRINPAGRYEQLFAQFSGGNQQRIVFAKWLQGKPKILLIDEPTQGVDVATKTLLHKQLLAAAADGAAVLISSSDTDELASLCQRVIVMHGGRIVETLAGHEVNPEAISMKLHRASKPLEVNQ
jgi:ribose transport system ATP-binding protein